MKKLWMALDAKTFAGYRWEMENELGPNRPQHIFTFPEKLSDGEVWVACWSPGDIVSQGETEEQALAALRDAIGFLCAIWAEEDGHEWGWTPTPPDVVAKWRKLHAKAHK